MNIVTTADPSEGETGSVSGVSCLLSFFKVIVPIKVPVSITDSIMIIRKRLLILMFLL